MNKQGFSIGINHPWQNYGFDFGDPVQLSTPPPNFKLPPRWNDPLEKSIYSANGRKLDTVLDWQLDVYARCNIKAVRWFIFADGWNLGTPTYNSGRWDYSPPSLNQSSSQVCSDFKTLLGAFAKTNLQLLPVLINHDFLGPAGFVLGFDKAGKEHKVFMEGLYKGPYNSVQEFLQKYYSDHPELPKDAEELVNWEKYIKGGKAAILSSLSNMKRFFDNVLEPLIDISLTQNNKILAWEVLNEPETAVDNKYATIQQLVPFLKEGISRICRKGLRATVGFLRQSTLDNLWGNTSLVGALAKLAAKKQYFPQIHYWPEKAGNDQTLKLVSLPNSIVGEFGSNEKLAGYINKSVSGQLQYIADANYTWAFPWSANANDAYSRWTAAVQDQIANFKP